MRKVFVFKIIMFIGFVLSCYSCDTSMENSCDPPMGVWYAKSSIEWGNYNNVETVYASNNLECSDSIIFFNNNRIIKVYGWIMKDNENVKIVGDSLYAFGQKEYVTALSIPIYCANEVKRLLDTSNLKQKCYVTGELKLERTMNGKGSWCCQVNARIVLNNVSDIYFDK